MLLIPAALALATSPLYASSQPDPLFGPAPLHPIAEDGRREDVGFSYTYIEIGATNLNVDETDDDVDIYFGRASIGFLNFLYAFGEYQNQSTNFEDTSTDLIELGLGAHFGAMPKLDFYAEVGWLYSDVSSDLDELDDTSNGYDVMGGVRWMALPWDRGGLELHGAVGYLDLDNRLASDDAATKWEAGARAHFLNNFSADITYSMLEDDDQISGSLRFSF